MGILGWLAIIAGIIGLMVMGLNYTKVAQHEENVRQYGIETEAVVTKNYSRAIEGNEEAKGRMVAYTYVKYVDNEGQEHEARLDVSTTLLPGSKVKVKYLPANYEYTMLIPDEPNED